MKGRSAVALAALLILSFAAGNAALYFSGRSLANRLKDKTSEVSRMQNEVTRLTEEKAAALREKEKISNDLVSHLATLNRIEQEKNGLKTELDTAEKKIESNKTLLVQLKDRLQAAEEKAREQQAQASSRAVEKRSVPSPFSGRTAPAADAGMVPPLLQGTGPEEQALYYYNLGVYFTRKDLFESAIHAYEQSLGFQADNPQACYNLGLLYWMKREDRPKAAAFFERYLRLVPAAEDRTEVTGWLRQLQANP